MRSRGDRCDVETGREGHRRQQDATPPLIDADRRAGDTEDGPTLVQELQLQRPRPTLCRAIDRDDESILRLSCGQTEEDHGRVRADDHRPAGQDLSSLRAGRLRDADVGRHCPRGSDHRQRLGQWPGLDHVDVDRADLHPANDRRDVDPAQGTERARPDFDGAADDLLAVLWSGERESVTRLRRSWHGRRGG
jgi:hypothetical protein